MIEALRTPDERFENLPDFPYPPAYNDRLPGFEGLRLAVVDVPSRGPSRGTMLCLHGEPTWSFLYRKMIPVFVAAGYRVVAPDFFGFGRSDKPVSEAVYSWDFHRNTLSALLRHLDLKEITLVCQDWGGLLGLTLPLDLGPRFCRLIVMNTALATGTSPSAGFLQWRDFCRERPDLHIGRLLARAVPNLRPEEAAAYDAPFVDQTFKAGVRAFPELVPIRPEMAGAAMSQKAADWWEQEWAGQSFMAIGELDPVLGIEVMLDLHQRIRGCPPPLRLPEAGHFVQEAGEEVAQAALRSFGE